MSEYKKAGYKAAPDWLPTDKNQLRALELVCKVLGGDRVRIKNDALGFDDENSINSAARKIMNSISFMCGGSGYILESEQPPQLPEPMQNMQDLVDDLEGLFNKYKSKL